MDNLKSLRDNCGMMIVDAEQQMMKEEALDSQMRNTHGVKWNVLPSSGMNAPFKQNIQMYRTKIQQAAQQDEMSKKRFQDQQGELVILTKTPQELLGMMTMAATNDELAKRPCAVAIKQALDNIDRAKMRKDELLKESVDNLANMNILDKLMEVH